MGSRVNKKIEPTPDYILDWAKGRGLGPQACPKCYYRPAYPDHIVRGKEIVVLNSVKYWRFSGINTFYIHCQKCGHKWLVMVRAEPGDLQKFY